MLGSLADAEDSLQDMLLAAWQGIGGYAEERASLRTWPYRIATNRCLNALRAASRRPAREWDVPGVQRPEPTRLGEVVWLEPYPSALLEGALLDSVPARANGQPAFGAYLRAPAGPRHGTGLYVLTLAGGRIRAMTPSRPACTRGSGCPGRFRPAPPEPAHNGRPPADQEPHRG